MKRPSHHVEELDAPPTPPQDDDLIMTECCYRGLNVQPPFADQLLNGEKTVECRTYPLGTHGTRDVCHVIKTKGGDTQAVPEVIGVVRFGQCTRYSDVQGFIADRGRHLIEQDSCFDWKGPAFCQMYAWEVESYIKFAVPIPLDGTVDLPRRSIIGWCKRVSLTPVVTRRDAMTLESIEMIPSNPT